MFQHIGIYFLSSGTGKLISFLALTLITLYLTPTEYGKWSMYLTLLAFIPPITGLMLNYHIARCYFKYSQTDLAKLIFNVLVINTLNSGVIFIILLLTEFYKTELWGIETYLLLYIPFLALNVNLKDIVTLIFRYKKKPSYYAIYEIGDTALSTSISLLFLIIFHWGWKSMLVGVLVSGITLNIFSFYYLLSHKYLKVSFDKNIIKEALKIGLPLVPHSFGGVVIMISDRFILEHLTSLTTVGIYSLGYTLGSTLQFFATAFNKAWSPWLYEKLAQELNPAQKKNVVKYTYIYFAGLTAISLLLMLGCYIYISYFIDVKYHPAIPVALWVTLAVLCQGLYFAIFPYMTHLGKTGIYPITTASAAIINIVLTILLVKWYGMVGAAQATFVSFFFIFIVIFLYSNKHFPMPWLNFARSNDKIQ
jgi:O-antigen/teichoic acid export membrane protein